MEGYNNSYRLRVGDYRVIYEMRKEVTNAKGEESAAKFILVILVIEIGNRGDVYK